MKNWYAAHIVMFVEFKNGKQEHFPIWENIVLIEAETEEIAFERADHCGTQNEGDENGSFRWDNKPSRWVFAGVRKVTECAVLADSPGDGTEITYTELQADSRAAIEHLVAGDPVKVCFNDRYRPALGGANKEPKRRRRHA